MFPGAANGIELRPPKMEAAMAFAVDHIDHVELFVRDIEAARQWYEEALGLKEVARWDPEPVMIGAGNTKLALFATPARAKPARAGDPGLPPESKGNERAWHRVAWKTDAAGFKHAQEHLRKLGIKFRGPVDHQTSWSIYFEDPDGHLLEITHYI
jgi:catechol 2,3-dioxygenase-like lactoylglutathione lyase family enzyme